MGTDGEGVGLCLGTDGDGDGLGFGGCGFGVDGVEGGFSCGGMGLCLGGATGFGDGVGLCGGFEPMPGFEGLHPVAVQSTGLLKASLQTFSNLWFFPGKQLFLSSTKRPCTALGSHIGSLAVK